MAKGNRPNDWKAQIREGAKRGVMVGLIAGSPDFQKSVLEEINKQYKWTDDMIKARDNAEIIDQEDNNRFRIRHETGRVSLVMYPKGASDSAKEGALKYHFHK